MLIRTLILCLLALSLGVFVESCATNPVTGKKELMLVSKEQEVQMGIQSDPHVVAMFGTYEDEDLQNFISNIGHEMAKISHRPDLPYEFKILDSPVVNAFALPGGFIYFTRGILAHFNNEAELAGVLGHEIGHVTARHGAKQQTDQTFGQLLLIGGMIASSTFRQFAQEAQQAMQLMFLKFGRDDERQSDKLGVEYATKIGYNTSKMADFFQTIDRLQDEAGAGGIPTFLSTHPDPANRYQKVHKMTEEWQEKTPEKNYVVNRESYLRMIDGMVYGEDPRQGYFDDGFFFHPELKFKFPLPGSDWQTMNSPQQVQMAPRDGQALVILTLTDAPSLGEAAEKVKQQHQLQVSDAREISVNGYPAIAMLSSQVNQQGQVAAKILTYLIQYEGLIYTFHGLSTPQLFNQYLPAFNHTMKNFDDLQDPSRINVSPERIDIVEVQRSTSLAAVFDRYNMPRDRYEELAILNGMELENRLQPGDQVKIISD